MDLDFVRIECDISSDTPASLTAALYDELRNFEAQFKLSCCTILQEPCTSCSNNVECPYRIVFAQQLSSDHEIVRLHQKPSLPFSLYISEMCSNMLRCTVGMVVVGSAINHIRVFHAALLRMIESAVHTGAPPATAALRSYSLDYQDIRHEISHTSSLPESVILLSGQHILKNTVHSDSARLTLKSPLRLTNNGSIAHSFDFAMFFRSQLRRCSSLCAYYGTGELELDFAGLSQRAQNVAVLEDGIHYTQPKWTKRLNRAGLTGSVECIGLVEPMFSLLLLGSYFNAGKGATFGLGFHKVEVL